MNYASLLKQAEQAKKAGYNDSQILDAFQQSPDQEFNKKIADLRSQVGDEKAIITAAQEMSYQANPLQDPNRAIGEAAIKYGKDIGNDVLTGSVGNVISGVGTMGNQLQGQSFDQAYQNNAQPIDVPFFGNINPRSKSSLQLTAQAAQLGAAALPVTEKISHMVAPLVGKSMANIAGAAVTGGLYGYGSEGQKKGATYGSSFEAAKTGAITSGVIQGGLEVAQRWPEIKRKVLMMVGGHTDKELQGIEPQNVQDFLDKPNKIIKTVNKAQDALAKAQAVKSAEYETMRAEALQNGNYWTKTDGLKQDTTSLLDDFGITTQNGKFTNESFLGTRWADDKTAQGQIKAYANQIFNLPTETDTESVDTIRQLIGKNTNFSAVADPEDKIGAALYGKVNQTVLDAAPELKAPHEMWTAWKDNLDMVGKKLDSVKSGEPFLMNAFGKNKNAVVEALTEIQNISKSDFLDEVRAASIAAAINSGKAGVAPRLIGLMGGAAIGGSIGGLGGFAGGAYIGRQIGRRMAPAINQWAGQQLVGALQESPLGSTMITQPINSTLQGIGQELFSPKDPTEEEKNYGLFEQAFRQKFPTAPQEQIQQAYETAVTQAHQGFAPISLPVQGQPNEQSYKDFADAFRVRFPNASDRLIRDTFNNLQYQ